MKLILLKEVLSICKLSLDKASPENIPQGSFFCITKTLDEISIVCEKGYEPLGCEINTDWYAFRVSGKLDFALTGILAGIAVPLANAGISIFAISTFDTDYILVKEDNLQKALNTLKESGFELEFIKSIG